MENHQTKKCFNCKKDIDVDSDVCPNCGVTIIERFEESKRPEAHKIQESAPKSATTYDKSYKTDPLDFLKNKGAIIFFVIIILIGGYILSSSSNSATPVNNSVVDSNTPVTDDPANYKHLPNGTIIKSSSYYLQGEGELTIENGTQADAVAKLVNIQLDKSIYTVYISAGHSYKIKNINTGGYKLIFAQGQGWDEASNKFFNEGASQFEEPLSFTIQNGYYTTYSVTLNPVPEGTAKTHNIPQENFDKY